MGATIVRMMAVVLAMLTASACITHQPTGVGSKRPELDEITCPDEVDILIRSSATCATLTVAAHHGQAGGGVVDLFVVRFAPEGAAPTAVPLLSVGGDLGYGMDMTTLGLQIDGLDREVIAVDPRGVGHSLPSLGCPELTALPVEPSALPAGSARVAEAFDEAVRTCRERLEGEGIDLTAFDLSEMAADMEDLRLALGIERWDVMSTGTTSRIALEYIRRDGEHVSAAVLDSPAWPGRSAPELLGSTARTVGELGETCREDVVCRQRWPDVERAVARVFEQLDSHPVRFRYGSKGTVLFDAGRFERWLRARLAFIRPPGTFIPHALASFADGSAEALELGATRSLGDRLCQGYLPNCWSQLAWSAGTYLTILCRDIVPFDLPSERARHWHMGNGLPEGSPWASECATWDAGTGDPGISEPLRTDVPVLVLLGLFDPYSSPEAANSAMTAMPHGSVIVSEVNGHAVTGTEQSVLELCMVRLRDAWLADPGSPPAIDCRGKTPFDFRLPLDWAI